MKTLYRTFKFVTFLIVSGIVLITGLYIYAAFYPKLELQSANSFQIYDGANNLVTQGSHYPNWTKLKDISPHLINAIISVEDKNFYRHQGFDYFRILKAVLVNLKNKNISQGASTISQQYVKNLYLDFGQSWKRKLEEAFLTMQLEINYNKKEILEGYLNTIYYGHGKYGIKQASNYYFNKEPSQLTLEEAIILAGIPRSPNNYNPVSNYQLAIKRAQVVATAMMANHKLTPKQNAKLFQQKIAVYQHQNPEKDNMINYYKDAVMQELNHLKQIPASLIESGGIKIYTNLDLKAQQILEEVITTNLEKETIQVASMVILPQTGKVIALTGGRDYSVSQFNRATQAKRQVGSTMKPFLYYAALENNFVSSSTFTSEATTFSLANGKSYAPTNYGDKYAHKPITMAAALALSDNVFAVKTNLFLGPEVTVEVAKRAGIKGKLKPVPSLALGTNELTMLDYARGYCTFASGGYQKEIHLINRVEDFNGNILYQKKEIQQLVLNPNYTYILNEMMRNTFNANFSDYTRPSALIIADKLKRKYAIKTGSTGTDFYVVGYNPDLLILVWTGYDDSRDLILAHNKYPKLIFADMAEKILADTKENWYPTPKNVIGIPKNAITGASAQDTSNSAIYYYVKGTENYVFKTEE